MILNISVIIIFSGVARGGGGRGAIALWQKLCPPFRPQMKLHFVQRSMESHHFESQSAPLFTPEPPCRPLILKSLATPLHILTFEIRKERARQRKVVFIFDMCIIHKKLSAVTIMLLLSVLEWSELLLFTKISNAHYWIFPNATRISRFSAYALAIFTEYTAWAAFGEMSRSALEIIFDFFLFFLSANQNRYANEVLNMRIW